MTTILRLALRAPIREMAMRALPVVLLHGLATTTTSVVHCASRRVFALIGPAHAEREEDATTQPPPATFGLLPTETKTQIFRELLLLRHGAIEYPDLEDPFALVQDIWARDPASNDRMALFFMNEAAVHPRRQAMEPQVLRVCREWYGIGRRILVDENVFLAVEGCHIFPVETHRRWKAGNLFHRFFHPGMSSVRPILTIGFRGPRLWSGLGGRYERPPSPWNCMLFDMSWAPEVIRELALRQYALYAPEETRGLLHLSIECQAVAAFRPKERTDLIKKLWADEIYPLLNARLASVHLCTSEVSMPGSTCDGSDGHNIPAGRAGKLLRSPVRQQRRDLALIRRPPVDPDRCMEPMFQVIESFLTDLRSFYLFRKWPSTRRDNFEYECARVHEFICQLDLRYREPEDEELPIHETILEAMVLFDLLLGLLMLRNMFPSTFTNLTGSTYRERREAGRNMLFDARTRLDSFEWEALSEGLIEEPRPLQRSYATIMYVAKCANTTAPPHRVVGLVQKAYALLRPDGQDTDWLGRKCAQVGTIVCDSVGSLVSYRNHPPNSYWWASGIWTDSATRDKLEVLLVKHWEETKREKFGDDDVFAVPRFKLNR